MKNLELFSSIIFSAPNERGGLFSVNEGVVRQIDRRLCTGLQYADTVLHRGIFKPAALVRYNQKTHEVVRPQDFADIHDILVSGNEVYVVATETNEIIKMPSTCDRDAQRWSFSKAADSWHINCLASWRGRIVFSCFGVFDQSRGYKGASKGSGQVRDLLTGEAVISGLSQPHSLLPHDGKLFLASSEDREILVFDDGANLVQRASFDAYPRGLAVRDGILFVGLSASRNIEVGRRNARITALSLNDLSVVGEVTSQSAEVYDIIAFRDYEDFQRTTSRVKAYERKLINRLHRQKTILLNRAHARASYYAARIAHLLSAPEVMEVEDLDINLRL